MTVGLDKSSRVMTDNSKCYPTKGEAQGFTLNSSASCRLGTCFSDELSRPLRTVAIRTMSCFVIAPSQRGSR